MFERFSQTQTVPRQHAVPAFFMLDRTELRRITYTLLPSLYHPGEVPRVCRETATLIKRWPGLLKNYGYRPCISLIGISEENINLVEKTMVAMMPCLPDRCHEFANITVKFIIHEKYIQVSLHLVS